MDAGSKNRQCSRPTVHIIDLLDLDEVFVEFAYSAVKSINSVQQPKLRRPAR